MTDSEAKIANRQINATMIIEAPDQTEHEIESVVSGGEDVDVGCILDTGAMSVCINDTVMRQLGFKPRGTIGIGGATASSSAPVYVAKVGIRGLKGFKVAVEVIGLPTRTALLGYGLFRHLDAIHIDLKANKVTFHLDGDSVTH